MRQVKARLTYANVMASVAVFIALGGTSYAAVSITGRDVRNNSLSGADVRNSSLSGADIRNRSLRSSDFATGQLKAGAKGEKGDKGDKGDPGSGGAGSAQRWVLLNEAGDIEEQSGGFTVISKPGINGQPATNPNIYVATGSSLVGKGLNGTIAIQNKFDRTGDGAADPAFQGDVSVARCATAAVNCVPAGTNAETTFVVRALADNNTVTSQTRRVYVEVIS